MATYFIDQVGGNNANDGLSFANRKKTFNSLGTLGAADDIRVMGSEDPIASGCDGTFVKGNAAIAVSPALPVQQIEACDSGWTASANITAAYTGVRVEGAGSLNLTPVAAFTTGKAAYKALAGAPLDLSAFDVISFVFRTTAVNTTTDGWVLNLCSDATGDVPVHSVPFGGDFANGSVGTGVTANHWVAASLYVPGGLGAGINSISLSTTIDPGTTSIRIDNVIVSTHASGIKHSAVVGKNTVDEPEWWPIAAITDSQITLGGTTFSISGWDTAPVGYYSLNYGAAELWFQPTLPAIITAERTLAGTNTINSLTGGWNRTDMSTQDRKSIWNGQGNGALVTRGSSAYQINTISDIYACRVNGAVLLGVARYTERVAGIGGTSGALFNYDSSNYTDKAKIHVDYYTGCVGQSFPFGSNGRIPDINLGPIYGAYTTSSANNLAFSSSVNTKAFSPAALIKVGRMYGGGGRALSLDGPFLISGLELQDIPDTDLIVNTTANAGLINGSFTEPLRASFIVSYTGEVWTRKGRYTFLGNSLVQNSVTHVDPTALQMIAKSNAVANQPFTQSIGKFYGTAGVPITIKAWGYKQAGITAGLLIPAYMVGGENADLTDNIVANTTWEELELTVTPTEDGVIEVFGYCYGTTNNSAYFTEISAA